VIQRHFKASFLPRSASPSGSVIVISGLSSTSVGCTSVGSASVGSGASVGASLRSGRGVTVGDVLTVESGFSVGACVELAGTSFWALQALSSNKITGNTMINSFGMQIRLNMILLSFVRFIYYPEITNKFMVEER
jgi:hypothetical protein